MTYVLITGAGSGIGFDTVRLLNEKGHKVVACVRTVEQCQLFDELEDVLPMKMDVTSLQDILGVLGELQAKNVKLKALVNNAGILRIGNLLQSGIQDLSEVFRVNALGAVLTTKTFYPLLKGGLVINICSDASLSSFPYTIAYSMSKHALKAFGEGLGMEQKDLKVYNLFLGNHDTPIATKAGGSDQLHNDAIRSLTNSRPTRDATMKIVELIENRPHRPLHFVMTGEEAEYTLLNLIDMVSGMVEDHVLDKRRINELLDQEFGT